MTALFFGASGANFTGVALILAGLLALFLLVRRADLRPLRSVRSPRRSDTALSVVREDMKLLVPFKTPRTDSTEAALRRHRKTS